MRTIAALVTSALVFLPVIALANIIPGTVLTGQITKTLNSHTAQVGDRFKLDNVASANGHLSGGVIYGHIARVIHAGQGQSARIDLAYDRLVTAHGHRYALDAVTTHIDVQTKSNALKEAGGAIVGLLAGNYIGKVLGTNAGGAVGAGGGYLYAKNNRADILLPENSSVSLQVESSSNL